MFVEEVLRGCALALAALFLLAVLHKFQVLSKGEAHREPLVVARGWGARGASVALFAGACIEVGIALALAIAPALGYAAAAPILAAYAWELRRLEPEAHCACFGEFLISTRRGAIRRNAALGLASFAAALAYVTNAIDGGPLNAETVGIALIVIALASADTLRRRLMSPRQESLVTS